MTSLGIQFVAQYVNHCATACPYFPMHRMKILFGGFDATVEKENIFQPTIGNVSLHQDSNYNGVIIVNFATSNNLVV
jgi:hypothetical protein